MKEFLTAPASPWQNAYAERVIGTIRRECLYHTIVLGEQHLRRTVKMYANYYNRDRNPKRSFKEAAEYVTIAANGRAQEHMLLLVDQRIGAKNKWRVLVIGC